MSMENMMLSNMKALLGSLTLLLLVTHAAASVTHAKRANASPTVKTNLGTFVGSFDPSASVNRFYGIPFAQPPVGKLRLQSPQPITAPFNTLDVSKGNTSRCIGIHHSAYMLVPGSEDCLTLDIIQPSVIPGELMAVYVFIHGGEFNDGDKSDIDGSSLVATNLPYDDLPILYVSINYRLSFLGFPSGAQAVSHNALNLGLQDQRMAMQWVKDNIQKFGGDPNWIILGGQAVGADAVTYQMMAFGGVDHGLFKQVFLESGTPTGLTPIPKPDWATRQNAYDSIVFQTGCSTASDPFVCLQEAPIDKLSQAFLNAFYAAQSIPHHVYAPVTDGTWFQDYPSVLMKQGKFVSVPTLMGTTTRELIYRIPVNANFVSEQSILGFVANFISYVPSSTLTQLFALFPFSDYANTAPGPPGSGVQWSRVVDIDNHMQSFCPMLAAAEQITSKGSDVWKYRWDARHSTATAPGYLGVNQGSDIPFLFSPLPNPATPVDTKLGLAYRSYVLSFINNGNVNIYKIPNGPPAWDWPTFANGQSEIVFSAQQVSQDAPQIFLEGQIYNNTKCDFIEAHNLDLLR